MISPGPDFILVTRNSLRYPRLQALATAFGVVAGCLVHATYCTLGLVLLITQSVLLFSLIKYAGAGYLVYLGLKGLTSSKKSSKRDENQSSNTISVRTAFLQGFFCNLLNPKLAVFLLSLFTQFISIDASIAQKASVAGVFILESVIYWPLVVLVFQQNIIRMLFARSEVLMDRIFGALMLGLGIRVALAKDS